MNRILIVDDIEDNRYYLRVLLEGNGFEIEQAANGVEALSMVQADMPDMIVSDILMPEMDGFTFCRILKENEQLKQIPFIFYTATYTDIRDEKLALSIGADAFLVKPMEPDEFIRQIRTTFENIRSKKFDSQQKPCMPSEIVLKEYNEALIRKLEHKMLMLEQANKKLEAEMSARQQVEKNLCDSEERYHALFENSVAGVLLTQPNGNILAANPTACLIFGRSEEEICRVGRSGVVDLADPRLQKALEERQLRGRFSGELTCLRKDGTRFPCEVSSAIFIDNEGTQMTSMIIRDITERRRAEDDLLLSIQERDVLLKEIHHRVKNNMQIISSLIRLQFSDDRMLLNPAKISTVALELQNRIESIALVHELLYQSKSLSKIDFNQYVKHIVASLLLVYNIKSEQVKIIIEVADKPVDITAAIPMGLIVNELLTNAIKYAFPSEKSGEIKILMSIDDDNTYCLTICDNGIGLPADFNIEKADSFGLHLVFMLVQQLNGTMKIHNNEGSVFTIQFK